MIRIVIAKNTNTKVEKTKSKSESEAAFSEYAKDEADDERYERLDAAAKSDADFYRYDEDTGQYYFAFKTAGRFEE